MVVVAMSLALFARSSKADPAAPSILDEATCTTEAACASACDAGNMPGCDRAASLHVEAQPKGPAGSAEGLAARDRACQKGGSFSCGYLGYLYTRGIGSQIPQDKTKSAEYYRRYVAILTAACDKNDGHACDTLGDLYLDGDEERLVTQDEAKAAVLSKKACDSSFGRGCYSLGFIYREGRSVPKDAARARELFTKGCGLNSGDGCEAIGNHQKACSLGNEAACDVLCKGGNTASCAHASKDTQEEVSAGREKQAATSRFPVLLQKCAANRAIIEQQKVAGFQAARAGNRAAADAATAKIRELEPQWSATLDELQKVIQLMSDGENPKLGQLSLQVKKTCTCDPDPKRPGGWCRRY